MAIQDLRISIDEVKRRLDRGESIRFVDARSEQAFSSSTVTIPGSIRVPPDRIDEAVYAVPRGGTVVAWCT